MRVKGNHHVTILAGQDFQDFVDGLVDGVSCFLLGGRAWAVFHVVHNDRTVVVQPAPRGRQPTWGGFVPQFLGFHLCQKIREIVASEEEYPYLSNTVAALLRQERQSRDLNQTDADTVSINGDEVTWKTYAGGRINSTLRYAILAQEPDWTVSADNFSIRARDSSITEAHFRDVKWTLALPGFWEDESLWQQIQANLPGYRLSKFQPLMPRWVEQEVLFEYLLDRRGTENWLNTAGV